MTTTAPIPSFLPLEAVEAITSANSSFRSKRGNVCPLCFNDDGRCLSDLKTWAICKRVKSEHVISTGIFAHNLVGEITKSDSPAKPVTLPKIVSAGELQGMHVPEMQSVIERLLPEGLILFAARPKAGKSWASLLWALAVSSGAGVWGNRSYDGEVLYLALEDSPRRMKSRIDALLPGGIWPPLLYFAYEWPRLDKGGMDALRQWLKDHPDASLVVIDTFTRIKPPKSRNGDSYAEDAAITAMLQSLALEFHIAIVLVVHQRKAQADDVFDTISGTLGLNASADAMAVLVRKRGTNEGELHLTGRDLEERVLCLEFDGGTWSYIGEKDEAVMEDRLAQAKAFLQEILANGPMDSAEIIAQGQGQGISRSKLFAAKSELGIKAQKVGLSGGWKWGL